MLKKTIIEVPAGIRYLGTWPGFSFSCFQGPCIINKAITGCGMTEFALDSKSGNVILCSPRVVLLENKYAQHKSTTFFLKSKNGEIDFDEDLGEEKNGSNKRIPMSITEQILHAQKLREPEYRKQNRGAFGSNVKPRLKKYLSSHDPKKFLITYDSFPILISFLSELGEDVVKDYNIMVDEFQVILQDSRFKSETENLFLESLSKFSKVFYVSATPMLGKYLDLIDEFRNLPYYELDWAKLEPGRLVVPEVKVRSCAGSGVLAKKVKSIIENYRFGGGEEITFPDDATGQLKTVRSKEAVLYFNSVRFIINAIKSNKLKPDEVNILCSNTKANQIKIAASLNSLGLGEFEIGRVPLRNEPRKMFTFCTRTVYLGADFYSDNAKTYIFSDVKKDYLAVDISQDLPQILGRQRLYDNPWKNSATFYYAAQFQNILDQTAVSTYVGWKEDNTDIILNTYQGMTSKQKETHNRIYEKYTKETKYSDNYVAIKKVYEDKSGKVIDKFPVFNNLVKVSDIMAFDISQGDYKDSVTLLSKVSDSFNVSTTSSPCSPGMSSFISAMGATSDFSKRCKLLCETDLITEEEKRGYLKSLPSVDLLYRSYTILGPERLKKIYYNSTKVKSELNLLSKFDPAVVTRDLVKGGVKPGDKISKSTAKIIIQAIYNKHGYEITAKSTDLQKYLPVSNVTWVEKDETGKSVRVTGYSVNKK